MPVHVDARNFSREVLQSDLPVVLDVWGPGCSPCKMLEPIVMSTPTLLFFKGRREVDRVTGFVGEMYIREIVESDLLEPAGG
jgi:hypothetical protein